MNDKELEKLVKKEIKEATKLDKSNIVILVMYALLAIYFAFTSIILKEASWLCLALAWVVIWVQEYCYTKISKLKDYRNNRQSEIIKFLEAYIDEIRKENKNVKKI